MLKMGKSKPWPEALEKLTGSKVLDVSAITEYFKPLNDWLVKQRQEIGYSPPGWDESPTTAVAPSLWDESPTTAGAPSLVPALWLNIVVFLSTSVVFVS